MYRKLIFLVFFIPAIASASVVLPAFPDVNQSTPYKDAINWTVTQGITKGYDNGNWGPDDCVTRGELVKMMVEYDFRSVGGFSMSSDMQLEEHLEFNDINLQDWVYPYVLYAKEEGIIEGYEDGTFKPNICVNRVEAMKIAVHSMTPDQILLLPGASGPLYYDDKIISDMYGVDWYAPYARFLFQNRLIGSQHTRYDAENPKVGQHSVIKFFPAEPMTRKEVAYLMMRIAATYPSIGN